MAMNIQEIYEMMNGLPPGAWVAISTEKRLVLSYGDDALKVFAQAKAAGEKIPFIGRVPEARHASVCLVMGRIKYNYTPSSFGNESALRPIVEAIPLFAPNGEALRTSALIDSGADFCLFPLNVARVLGLDLNSLSTAQIGGVGNAANLTFYDTLTIELGDGVIFDTRVGFTEGMDRFGFGLLGQKGFFENYNVEFRYRERSFTIEPARSARK